MKLTLAIFLSAIAIIHGAPSEDKGHVQRSNDYIDAKLKEYSVAYAKKLKEYSAAHAKEISKLRQANADLAASIINEENLRQLIQSEIHGTRFEWANV